jgi:hypothetical protein
MMAEVTPPKNGSDGGAIGQRGDRIFRFVVLKISWVTSTILEL